MLSRNGVRIPAQTKRQANPIQSRIIVIADWLSYNLPTDNEAGEAHRMIEGKMQKLNGSHFDPGILDNKKEKIIVCNFEDEQKARRVP